MNNLKIIALIVVFVTSCQSTSQISAEQTKVIETQAQLYINALVSTFSAETEWAIQNNPTSTEIPTETPTEIPPPTEDLLGLPIVPETVCVPTNTQRDLALVVAVIDGHTIDVSVNGQNYRVRYIGIDPPDAGSPLGVDATNANRQLVENKQALLVKDVSEYDQYGNLLRYVFIENQFVNFDLVKNGYAKVVTQSPDVACEGIFLVAQQSAIENKHGLWVPTPTSVILPTLAPTIQIVQPTQAPSQGGSGATAVCNDGSYSYSQHRRGTCSHHGGVREWLRNVAP